MINIYLSNMEFRYDVYQILNLFYVNEEINFVDGNGDINIVLSDNSAEVYDKEAKKTFDFHKELSYKESLKLAVFLFLKEKTKKDFPWGTLVGIRPSKIALNLLQKGLTEEEIIKYYDFHYNAKASKARLCIDVARLESKYVNSDTKNISVYIGMPFCPTRCVYCSFASNPIGSCGKLVSPYLEALKKEVEAIGKYIKEKALKIQCVYFGGGTPTSVNNNEFEDIMQCIYKELIHNNKVSEFTVECGRPDSITYEKLVSMKNYKVHRISINPQTMNDQTLKTIGRHHSVQEVCDKFHMARELGFDNINMDLIVGLQGEDYKAVENTCRQIHELNPDSITVHGLSVKRASKLHENLLKKNKDLDLSQDEINDMYNETVELAAKLNMKPYYMYRQKNMFGNMENVGYSKAGKEGIYNIQMIEEKMTIIAAGADAVTKVVFLEEDRIERFANVKDVKEYVNRVDEMINKKLRLLDDLYK